MIGAGKSGYHQGFCLHLIRRVDPTLQDPSNSHPCCFLPAQHQSMAHLAARLTLPHHLPVSPPPASMPHCQTICNWTFSKKLPIYLVSMAMRICAVLCCYCTIVSSSVRAWRRLWRQRREEPFCQEDNYWSPWNIKFRLRFAENVEHWSHSCVPWHGLCLCFMWLWLAGVFMVKEG